MALICISHPDCEAYDPGPAHPDQPERLWTLNDRIISTGLDMAILHRDAPLAGPDDLALVHDRDYVAQIFALEPAAGWARIDDDTWMVPGTLAAARRSAGAAIMAADAVLGGETDRAFCAVRPPGHHAERARAMGFCFFNNAALAAARAMERHGLQRVAIADFDVHHGNGTEEIFADDPRVLFCSCFQDALYPGTGRDRDEPGICDVPLAAGTAGPAFREAVGPRWRKALADFRPELVVISAGFDGHAEDDMGALMLGEADYRWITELLVEAADTHAGGRIVSILEGGYVPDSMARSAVAHLRALL